MKKLLSFLLIFLSTFFFSQEYTFDYSVKINHKSLTTNDNEILLYVYANSEDVARLIGRKGIMASSIRQMMSIAARDVHKRISVKFEAY